MRIYNCFNVCLVQVNLIESLTFYYIIFKVYADIHILTIYICVYSCRKCLPIYLVHDDSNGGGDDRSVFLQGKLLNLLYVRYTPTYVSIYLLYMYTKLYL